MSTQRINFSSKSVWEPLRGYSRAVQVGDSLFISGTTAVDARGEVIAPNDPYEQTRFVIGRIRDFLSATGFTITDVVRTRLFVTNLSRWEDYAKAHRDAFESIRPASSIVQVARLVDPRLTIEMEVDAIKGATQVEYRSI